MTRSCAAAKAGAPGGKIAAKDRSAGIVQAKIFFIRQASPQSGIGWTLMSSHEMPSIKRLKLDGLQWNLSHCDRFH
jgi:hypothetical protein